MASVPSVQFTHLVVSDSLQPHGLQHARPPCSSPTSGVCSNSCPSSQWCHPTISSSAIPFSSCLQSFPASGFFSSQSVLHIRWPKYWSFSFSISPSNEYWGLISFRIDFFDLLAVQGNLKSLLQHYISKASILWQSAFFIVQLSHKCWRIGAFERWCWRRFLRIPWTARRSNQSILKEINPQYSLKGLMLKLKLQYFGHMMWRAYSLEKTLMLGKIEGRRKGGWQRTLWLDCSTYLMNMSLNKLSEMVKDRDAYCSAIHFVT